MLHRTGLQFYEVATYAVACGVVCLAVFRGLSQEAFGAVWIFKQDLLTVDWRHIVVGEQHTQMALCVSQAGIRISPVFEGCAITRSVISKVSEARKITGTWHDLVSNEFCTRKKNSSIESPLIRFSGKKLRSSVRDGCLAPFTHKR